jgi:hypothetical protein
MSTTTRIMIRYHATRFALSAAVILAGTSFTLAASAALGWM